MFLELVQAIQSRLADDLYFTPGTKNVMVFIEDEEDEVFEKAGNDELNDIGVFVCIRNPQFEGQSAHEMIARVRVQFFENRTFNRSTRGTNKTLDQFAQKALALLYGFRVIEHWAPVKGQWTLGDVDPNANSGLLGRELTVHFASFFKTVYAAIGTENADEEIESSEGVVSSTN